MLKRTRAKSPCFWVGQLDCSPSRGSDLARILASEYQALLPPRTFTPVPEPQILGKSIRKVKGQQSLRDLIERDKQVISVSSDCDTLVGSESPRSPLSPTSEHPSEDEDPPLSPTHSDQKAHLHYQVAAQDAVQEEKPSNPASVQPTAVGFQLCLDLLTEQLSTGLFKKHPAEELDRPSSLQLLLMIESYESIRQQIRRAKSNPSLTGKQFDHMIDIEQTLEHWLHALYGVYDNTVADTKVSNDSADTATVSNDSVESFHSCLSYISTSAEAPSSVAGEPACVDECAPQETPSRPAKGQWRPWRKLQKPQKRSGRWWTRELGN